MVKVRNIYAKTPALRQEIAALRAEGKLLREIAEAVGVNRQTVSYHLQQIAAREAEPSVGVTAEVKGFREQEAERRKCPFTPRTRKQNQASRQPKPEPVKLVPPSLLTATDRALKLRTAEAYAAVLSVMGKAASAAQIGRDAG